MSFLQALKNTKTGVKVTEWLSVQAGYRNLGLKHDDLIADESEVVQEALRRLPRREFYDRIFRHRRAMNLSGNQQELPRELWTKPEEDTPYLTLFIEQVERENAVKQEYDQMVGIPQHLKSRNRC